MKEINEIQMLNNSYIIFLLFKCHVLIYMQFTLAEIK